LAILIRDFEEGLAQLSSNDHLVLAGTLHGVHAITSRLTPTVASSSGAHVIEAETFKMTIYLTPTGMPSSTQLTHLNSIGTKFVLLTSLSDQTADTLLQKVYEIYADTVMKNPFHNPEMPIRTEAFDTRINALLGV
jgi:hypothetical protein